ncbi:MAG TPA: rod shape-determining protein RodA [Novosphingobium sp.]|nr:rod shape-determining protein RodA [Novosphingobium sp.]
MSRSIVPEPVARQPWSLLIPLVLLTLFGSAVLYTAAGGAMQPWAANHLIRFALFLVAALVLARFPRDLLKLGAYPAYGLILALLLLVELIGAVGGGSQRWLNLGFMQLQPSELMKPGIVLVLARFFDALPPSYTGHWRGLLPAGVLIALPAAMVMLQPDLGTALAICFGGAVVMFLAGLPLRWFIGAGAAVLVLAPLAFFTLLHDYQRRRVTTFLDPESDPLGSGYHISQSKIAIGSGGFFGKGFGQGSQSHLEYLPEAHTDFVFATMAEEWGMIGGLFLPWGLAVARRAPGRFSRLLAAGMTCTIFFYVAINLMMVMGLAPVVGIPLPFMSHGGSSMMTNMICIGAIMAVDRWNRRPGGLG